MKHLATKERRRDREEFAYRHRDSISEEKRIVWLARKELGYSCRTADCDIYSSLNKTLNQLVNNLKT